MNADQVAAIRGRLQRLESLADGPDHRSRHAARLAELQGEPVGLTSQGWVYAVALAANLVAGDVPDLLAEVDRLRAEAARARAELVCEICAAAIRWEPNEPTRQAPGWRHVDQAGSYRFGNHRAWPGGPIGNIDIDKEG